MIQGNDHALKRLLHLDSVTDPVERYRVAVGVEVDVSLNVNGAMVQLVGLWNPQR